MNSSNQTEPSANSFIAALSVAQSSGSLYQFERTLRYTLDTSARTVQEARTALQGEGQRNPLLLEALDKLLSAVASQDDSKVPKGRGAWTTLALSGVLSYTGQDVLNRVSDTASLRKHVAKALGLAENEVVVSGLVMSAEGAYGLLPAEAVALGRFWRAVGTIPAYRTSAEAVCNHRILPFEGETRLQVVHLIHVLLEPGEDPEAASMELNDSFGGGTTFDYRFFFDNNESTTASFSVWGSYMPWEAFQQELYLYEATHVVNVCVHIAHQRRLPLNSLNVHLELLSPGDETVSLRIFINSKEDEQLHVFAFERLTEPLILQRKTSNMLDRLGIPVRAPVDVRCLELHEHLGPA